MSQTINNYDLMVAVDIAQQRIAQLNNSNYMQLLKAKLKNKETPIWELLIYVKPDEGVTYTSSPYIYLRVNVKTGSVDILSKYEI